MSGVGVSLVVETGKLIHNYHKPNYVRVVRAHGPRSTATPAKATLGEGATTWKGWLQNR